MIKGKPGKFRRCEVRTVVFDNVEYVDEAVDKVFSYVKGKNRTFINTAGNKVYFEFVGVLDYIKMGGECDDSEVWYDYVTMKEPMENRKKIAFISRAALTRKICQDRKNRESILTNKNSDDHSHTNISYDIEQIFPRTESDVCRNAKNKNAE
jgi:hypothetical protein